MTKRLLLIAALLALFVHKASPGAIHATKFTGAGAVINLSTGVPSGYSTVVHGFQLIAASTNAANAFWGDASLTATTNGAVLPAGAGQFWPPQTPGGYDLAGVWIYVANSDVVYLGWEEF